MRLKIIPPNKELAAVCGLFCPSCAVFIATQEDSERLESQAEFLNLTVEETKCNGCRSNKRNGTCESCYMLKCATEKNIDFCVHCDDYPCMEIKKFQSKMPHRVELWADLENIKQMGWEKWYLNQIEHYQCESCETINSGWDLSCTQCGNTPSSPYVRENENEIKKRM